MIEFNRKTDFVSIIAPSSACRSKEGTMDIDLSHAQLKKTISLFEQHGFKCKYDENIFSCNSLEFFANTKEERMRLLKDALLDPEVKIISAFRGGYGAAEIVFDCIDIRPISPKILVGFSDITVLHFLFNQQYNLPSIHGAVDHRYPNMMPEFISVMQGDSAQFKLKKINNVSQDQNIDGLTTGGNLTLITTMIGTKLHPQTKNKILIIEEVGEISYRVHRYLLHLFHAGIFDEVAAIVFGDFSVDDDNIDKTISHFVENYIKDIPVFRTKNLGHVPINYPFAMNSMASIQDDLLNIKSPFKLV